MSDWLNTTKVIHQEIEKPCEKLNYCPYGALVEGFPLPDERPTALSCPIMGHDCPVHYHAEFVQSGLPNMAEARCALCEMGLKPHE